MRALCGRHLLWNEAAAHPNVRPIENVEQVSRSLPRKQCMPPVKEITLRNPRLSAVSYFRLGKTNCQELIFIILRG